MSQFPCTRRNAILSSRQVFGVVLLALTLAFLLIPRNTELVERLVKDGQHERARELVAKTASLANETPTVGDGASAENLIAMLLENQPGLIPSGKTAQIATLIEIISDTAATRRVLEAHAEHLSDRSKAECLAALAKRAVQLGEPSAGAHYYDEMWELQNPDENQLRDVVATKRYANDPKAALDCISRYLSERAQPFHRLPEDLRMITVSLHRELNDGSRAFDLLSREYLASVDDNPRHELMDLMTETAAQSERLEDCLPILQQYLATLSASSQTWQQLLKPEAAHPSDEDFRKYGSILARHQEWNGQPVQAFDLYCKLAAMGDPGALDRCVTIYPWVGKQNETTELLSAMAPIPYRPQYTMLAARLEADRGELELAISLMEPVMHRPPEQKVADGAPIYIESDEDWLEYAQILEATGQFEKAITAYRNNISLAPGNPAALKPTASLLVALGRNNEALAVLSQLSAEDHDPHSLENYLMLASALNDTDAELRALEMRIANHAGHPQASDFQDLSEFWQREGSYENAVETSRRGVAALPTSKILQLNLIDQLIESNQFGSAYDEIRRYDDPSDPRFTSRLLQVANEVSAPEHVLEMMRQRPSEITLSPRQTLELAALYESVDSTQAALNIYRSTRGGKAGTLRMEAQIAYERGDILSALNHQRRYLDTNIEPDYRGWMFLGDLLTSNGNSTAAREAYQRALTVLRRNLNKLIPSPDSPSTAIEARSRELPSSQSKAG